MLRIDGELPVYETPTPEPPLTDPEEIRLDVISQIRQHREDFLKFRQEADRYVRIRKAAALFPLVAALGIASIPGFKHQSKDARLIEEGYIVLFSSVGLGVVEGTRRSMIKKSKDSAKEAREVGGKIDRQEDAWITDALDPPKRKFKLAA